MKGRNTVFSVHDGAALPGAFITIAKVYSIAGGNRSVEKVEDDDLLDASEVRLSEPGAAFHSDLVVELQFDPADADASNHNELEAVATATEERFFKVKYPNAEESGEIWHGYISDIGTPDILPNAHVRRRVTITPTGKSYIKQDDIDAAVLPSV